MRTYNYLLRRPQFKTQYLLSNSTTVLKLKHSDFTILFFSEVEFLVLFPFFRYRYGKLFHEKNWTVSVVATANVYTNNAASLYERTWAFVPVLSLLVQRSYSHQRAWGSHAHLTLRTYPHFLPEPWWRRDLTFILCPDSPGMGKLETCLLRNKTKVSEEILESITVNPLTVFNQALSRFKASFPHPGSQAESEK